MNNIILGESEFKAPYCYRIKFCLSAIVLFLFCSLENGSSQIPSSDPGQDKNARKMIPYTLPWDDMPVDLSFVYKNDKPAGNHGFLKAQGEKFIFEDGTEARFWGTNFNSAQNFPSHEHSEKVAKRLAKTGVNIVRFHQLDGEWSTPNIFSFSRGENLQHTMSFDSESMDRLDYLIYCLKNEGIYVYMDLLTYRRFQSGDGVEAVDRLGDAAKPYSTYNRKLIELQKKFNSDLWNHINHYTKLAYKDEPAIVMCEIINEADLWSNSITVEPYRTELETMYRTWASENNVKVDQGKIEFNRSRDVNISKFFIKVTTDYYQEMIAHMRGLGVKIPIAGTNQTRNAAQLTAQKAGDFTDSHAYQNFDLWGDGSKRFMNESMTGKKDNMIPVLAYYSVQDKPFFVSEWDNPWPNEWRAEGPLLLAAVGVMQGWGGFTIHTYRYSLDENVDMIAKPLTGEALNGVRYRGGLFDTFNDPAKYGLFYHAALITRRGDVKIAEKTVNIQSVNLSSGVGRSLSNLLAEQHRVKTVLPDEKAKSNITVNANESYISQEAVEVISDTKELYRNLEKKIGWINSPRTKAVYGFVGKEGVIQLTDVDIDVKTDFATVAISSLTDDPISYSANILLTAVGRAENTNFKLNDERTQVLNIGNGPILVEVIEAIIKIKTDKKNLRVMSINPQGSVTGFMPSEYKDGIFSFEIGKEFQSMYYLIQEM